MNWAVFLLFLGGFVVCASTKTCRSASDCGDDQCCLGLCYNEMLNKGLCIRRSKLGARCSEPEAALEYFNGKYLVHCPCDSKYECRSRTPNLDKSKDLTRYLKDLRCQKPESTEGPNDITTVAPEEKTEPTVDDNNVENTETPVVDDNVVETEPPVVDDNVVETEPPVVDDNGVETEPPIVDDNVVETEPPAVDDNIVETEPPVEDDNVEAIPSDELPIEIGEGPGGEPPRDDDCEDWTYGC